MNVPKSCASMALATLAIVQPACASLLSGTITGSVIQAGSAVPGVTAGSPVSGAYVYDDSTTVDDNIGPVNPLTSFSLTFGTNPHVVTLSDLQTGWYVPGVFLANSTPTVHSLLFFFLIASYTDYFGGGIVRGQAIGGIPPQFYQVLTTDPAKSLDFRFVASPVTVIRAVPEPEILVLLSIGATAMGAATRRRSRPSLKNC